MIIAVDFDGTLCENKYPEIGEPNQDLISHILDCQESGNKFILWTCRTGKYLNDAIYWCSQHGILFDAVNENLPERLEEYGSDCRKIFADEYWDDKAYNMTFPQETREKIYYKGFQHGIDTGFKSGYDAGVSQREKAINVPKTWKEWKEKYEL